MTRKIKKPASIEKAGSYI